MFFFLQQRVFTISKCLAEVFSPRMNSFEHYQIAWLEFQMFLKYPERPEKYQNLLNSWTKHFIVKSQIFSVFIDKLLKLLISRSNVFLKKAQEISLSLSKKVYHKYKLLNFAAFGYQFFSRAWFLRYRTKTKFLRKFFSWNTFLWLVHPEKKVLIMLDVETHFYPKLHFQFFHQGVIEQLLDWGGLPKKKTIFACQSLHAVILLINRVLGFQALVFPIVAAWLFASRVESAVL